ncbi:TonB-linked outer membrane protein, SusC/RagA family [Pricia antarctica]|uniref:TonB-linked outer membrane protein, SusC/RagA family n=1 Tax=Pricia antarctica TaxID=641691 RepID=A0A1G6WQ79_9FLAO|nr:TonB-dependent receptor [Pricia antarctica]SDD67971.1 TonB-linked outer membrane protein, SusC/RagA family [Pricia antarctica]
MKQHYENARSPWCLLKIDLKLKLTVFSLIFSLFQAQANSYANKTVLRIPLKNASFEKKIPNVISIPFDKNTRLQQQISGTVSDATGVPLAGANILEKGTTNGTQTDFDGNFTLEVGDDAILVISYIGFTTKEVSVDGQSNISVSLDENAAGLDEVVVVGYGTQSRAKVTGAISTVPTDQIAQRPVTNTANALQGQVPGLTVFNSGGAPGVEDVKIRIRGVGTLNNSNPLVLVDGIEQSLGTVEPQNIESISVLKDAASAAIYGSRAANGVILVTTKRGASTGVKLSYNALFGVQHPSFFPEKADDESWMRLENTAQVNAGGTPTYSEEYISNVLAGTKPLEFPFANWEEGIFRNGALMNQHSFSISAGSEIGKIFTSVNYNDTDGVIKNFNNKRTTVLVNADLYANDKLTFKVGLMYRNGNFSGPGHAINSSGIAGQQIVQALLHMNRNVVMEYPDGTYDLISGQWNADAMATEGETNRISNDVVAQGGIDYSISDALTLRGNVTYKSNNQGTDTFMNSLAGMKNYVTGEPVTVSGWFATNKLTEATFTEKELSQRLYLDYEKDFGSHDLGGLLGYEEIHYNNKIVSASREGFFNNDLRDLDAGGVDNQQISGHREEWRLRSVFGRLNYSFDDRYLLQANLRIDGSSRFGDGNRYGYFPSVSAGWNITNESFMENVSDGAVLSNLKLRASWGQLGNQDIGLNKFRSTYNLNQNYQFAGNPVSGSAITQAGNPNITWETATITNIGLDASFLNDRLSFVAEYFWKYTDDILLELPISSTIGVDAPVQNAAAVSNNGYELSLSYNSVYKPDNGFNYSIGVNFSDVINKIEDLKGAGPYFNDGFTVWQEGYSINTLRGLDSPGLYRTQADLDQYPVRLSSSATIGDIIYKDVNGDGVISQSLAPGGDQIIIGNEDPRYEFGIRASASFKGFDLSMFWQGVGKQYHTLDGALVEGPAYQNFIPSEMTANAYDPVQNPDGTWPRAIAGGNWNIVKSNFWLVDTKYIRLKNFQVGYTIDQKVFSNFRIYVSGENMVTFTPQNLFDPETPRGRSQFFPQTKTMSLGLNIEF